MRYIYKTCCQAEYFILEGFQKIFYKTANFKKDSKNTILSAIEWFLIRRFLQLDATIYDWPEGESELLYLGMRSLIRELSGPEKKQGGKI
jgi:hypothetical protein